MELKSKDTDRADGNIRLTLPLMMRMRNNLVIHISHSRQLSSIYLVLKDLQERLFHRFLQEHILIFQFIFLISNPNPFYCHLATLFLSVPCIDGKWLVLLIKYNVYSHPDRVIQLEVEMTVPGRKAVTLSSFQPVRPVKYNMSGILAPLTLNLSRRQEMPQDYGLGLLFILETNQAIQSCCPLISLSLS